MQTEFFKSELWRNGVDRICLLSGCAALVGGVYLVFGYGYALVTAGLCLIVFRKPLTIPLEVYVMNVDGDVDEPEHDEDEYEDEYGGGASNDELDKVMGRIKETLN